MIQNSHCAYCQVELIIAENDPRSRSVEHMIPNAVLTWPRSPGNGDFYACRACNSAKSKIDYVLAVVAKAQSADAELATKTLLKAFSRDDKRFVQMMRTAERHADEVHIDIPIDGKDLYEYLCFLGKGQHFRHTGTIFDPRSHVIQVEFINKQITERFERSANSHGANPLADLARNPQTESIGGGDCLIYSKGCEHMFLFHRYTCAIVSTPLRTEETETCADALQAALLEDFPALGSRPTE